MTRTRNARFLPALILALPPLAFAQGGIEEITVTAQKREETMRDVPISMAVETGASLLKKSIKSITELGRQTPNLYIEDQGSTNAVSLRGLGSPAEGLESPVGFYLDGIAVSRALGLLSMPFFDLERVEVLRGPQSTFFGRNTSAGAINVISAKPGEETEGRVRVRAGNRQMREYEGALSGPITDSISGRLALVSTERGAYLDNPLGQDAGGDDKFGARGQLAFTPNESFDALFKYEYMTTKRYGTTQQGIDPGPGGIDLPINQYLVAQGEDFKTDLTQHVVTTGIYAYLNEETRWTARMKNLQLVMNYHFGDGYTLTSQTGHLDTSNSRVFNYSGLPINSIMLTTRYSPVDFTSTELRLTSPDDGSFTWMAGLYYDEMDTEQTPTSKNGGAYIFFHNPTLDTGVPAANLAALNGDTEESKSYSAFAEGTYAFTDQLKFGVGLRYGKEEKDALDKVGLRVDLPNGTPLPLSALGIPGFPNGALYSTSYTDVSQVTAPCFGIGGGAFVSPDGNQCEQALGIDDKFLTWSAKLQYQINDDINLYATVATGYKGGGIDNGGNTFVLSEKLVKNEDSIAYEIGSKSRLLDGRLLFNVAAFINTFDDLQVGAQSPDTGVIVVRNAAEAETKGIETDVNFSIDEHWSIGGSIALLDTEFKKFPGAGCGAFAAWYGTCVGSFDAKGNELPGAAGYSGSAFIALNMPIADSRWDFDGNVNVSFRDKSYAFGDFANESERELDSYEMVNAMLSIVNRDNGLTIALVGSNLTDERAVTGNQTNPVVAAQISGWIMRPREYGVEVSYAF